MYIEDYYLCKEGPLTDEEAELLNDYHKVPFRTKRVFIEQLEGAGFRVEELEDYSAKWSEFAWNRAEKINAKHAIENLPADDEVIVYGINSPKLLCHVNYYSELELAEKFPYTHKLIGSEYVFSKDKLLGVLRIAAFKD